MWTDHTEYEECQKLQLLTVVRYQHNNTLGNVSSSRKSKRISRYVFFPISHTPTVHQSQEWHCCWIKMYIKTSTVDLSVDAKKLHLQKLWIALLKTGGIRNAWLKFKCCAWATERKHFSLFFTSQTALWINLKHTASFFYIFYWKIHQCQPFCSRRQHRKLHLFLILWCVYNKRQTSI